MTQQDGAITFKGAPQTLVGELPEVGAAAPQFSVLDGDLSPVALSSFRGKTVVIVSVPSLDTPVCATEARRFNEAAANLGDDVVILVVSMDLPFAQGRFCAAEGIDAVRTLSDHRDGSFAAAYGVMIKQLRLLARAVFVVNAEGKLIYLQLVGEMTEEPDYDEALTAVAGARSA